MERIFVRFRSQEQKIDVLRTVASIGGSQSSPRLLFAQPDVLHLAASDAKRVALEKLGAEIFEDVQFDILPGDEEDDLSPVGWPGAAQPDLADDYSMQDVIEQVRAQEAWPRTRGEGVTIAIVDTGVAGALGEFAPHRRSPIDPASEHEGKHWTDPHGHGSMCAAIAAAARADGGRYDGIAPGATVLAARSTLKSTDLVDVYDELLRARAEGSLTGPLVISNSYGLKTCSTSGILPVNHPYMTGVLAAVAGGVFVCFAAGNNHRDVCQHDPMACGPNSIWGPGSHDDIVSVGTVNRDFSNCDPATPHVNSSRGPGEWARKTTKPDCVAPTYGEVIWGTSTRRMRWWGTSGACPQVAGAAALMLSANPGLSPELVGDIIRDSCGWIADGRTCVGHGVLDCAEAVEQAIKMASTS
jgi:subtilisin family serine protease